MIHFQNIVGTIFFNESESCRRNGSHIISTMQILIGQMTQQMSTYSIYLFRATLWNVHFSLNNIMGTILFNESESCRSSLDRLVPQYFHGAVTY